MPIVKILAQDGTPIEFVDESPMQGGMKDAYFSPDCSYVVAFFRNPIDSHARARLDKIVGTYRDGIFELAGGDYWKKLFCWPEKVVEYKGRTGIVVPAYASHFFFSERTAMAGAEKEGKWFASGKNLNRFVPQTEKGTLLSYLKICTLLCRAVRRLHAAGLAHSDLSYKNCLVDPAGMNVCIIDIDGLVVPGMHPPEVLGTPDFIAPEVLATQDLPLNDPHRKLPCRSTDQHALAVLVYMYLLHRHPLRGGKIHSMDDQQQELMEMGTHALFVEHPTDASNRCRVPAEGDEERPWNDPQQLPYTVCGPYVSHLFERAFIDGLHNPKARPTADDWENALVKTWDLFVQCVNFDCKMGWFIPDLTAEEVVCPYCGMPHLGEFPVLQFSSTRNGKDFISDGHCLTVGAVPEKASLFPWHVDRSVYPNERIAPAQCRRVGYFQWYNGRWFLFNETLPELADAVTGEVVEPGNCVELTEGLRLRFSSAVTGKIADVTIHNILKTRVDRTKDSIAKPGE